MISLALLNLLSYSPNARLLTTHWICFRVLFLQVPIKPGSLPKQPGIKLRHYFLLLWYTMHWASFLVAQGIITFLGGIRCNNLPLTWKECPSMPKNNKCIKFNWYWNPWMFVVLIIYHLAQICHTRPFRVFSTLGCPKPGQGTNRKITN